MDPCTYYMQAKIKSRKNLYLASLVIYGTLAYVSTQSLTFSDLLPQS